MTRLEDTIKRAKLRLSKKKYEVKAMEDWIAKLEKRLLDKKGK